MAILGVGNPMRGDDGLGPHAARRLAQEPPPRTLVLDVESVPEAFTGKVEEFGATHVVIIDAANLGGAPGETRLIEGSQIKGVAISTHSLPLNIFIHYVEEAVGAEVRVVGVQPASLGLGEGLTPRVEEAVDKVVEILRRILSG